MMVTLSTCWKSSRAECADDIISPILAVGVTSVELEYRITDEIFGDLLPALRRGEPKAVSVHNFFPIPLGFTRDQASGDIFSLSSPDREERERAVRYTVKTLEHAHDVGAQAVVLHLGTTQMDDQFERLTEEREMDVFDEHSVRDRVKALLEEREKAGRKRLDAALFSLDKLWKPAERYALKLGVENRYHLREMPDEEELAVILERFEGSSIGYWHDVGHAAVQQFLYGTDHEQLLSRFCSRLIGVHLHDADGVKDHQTPGTGKVDFAMVKRLLPSHILNVMELAPEVTADEVRQSIEFLTGIFG
jgi:sugar phosphate isomerase/epimerase